MVAIVSCYVMPSIIFDPEIRSFLHTGSDGRYVCPFAKQVLANKRPVFPSISLRHVLPVGVGDFPGRGVGRYGAARKFAKE